MNILSESNPRVIGFLGGYLRRFPNVKYRFCSKIIKTNYLDKIILYNVLTGASVSLFDFEYNNIDTTLPCDYSSFLYGNYFLVREDFDENKVIDDYRKLTQTYISPTYLDRSKHFTILTTSKCNANCTYCYEQMMPNKRHMTDKVAMDVVKYIVDSHDPNGPITLQWFGGEPLYNSKVIDMISSNVCSAGLNFTSSIITNGYLFDDNLIAKAVNMWKLEHAQITLDGTEEEYNKTKRFMYKNDPSPFNTIIDNIHKLLNAGVHITIRLNCDKNNYQNLIELVHYIRDTFKGYNNISMYVWEIFSEEKRSVEEANIQFRCMDEVDKAIYESGMAIRNIITSGIKSEHCLIDSGQGVNIDMDGNLFLCEHHIHNNFFGDIYHPEIKDFNNFKEWRNYTDNHSEQCLNCPLRPSCLKVHRCTDQHECVGYEQQYYINQAKRQLNTLQDNFNNPSTDIQCNCCTLN